ncbi:hypothetical protein TSUD_160670 [Trifolium subterraneum]|uniref:Uncharacterized protein n=1 Tax=Trifolium subterraneum TaxID=3900 RepID=A0A2Z6MTH5_TRISU|nr:hypothetical protein TSUD_160670 [Trifolium subterraneum]
MYSSVPGLRLVSSTGKLVISVVVDVMVERLQLVVHRCIVDGTMPRDFKVILPIMQLQAESHGITRNMA